MADKFMQLVLTPAVQQAQDKYFGKHQVVENAPETDPLTRSEAYFIASRDSFYMATVSETGWPYVHHRGGPPGFVKVLGPNLIGFADFKGDCQLVSTGNLGTTDRVALFMMDCPHPKPAQTARPRPRASTSASILSWPISSPPNHSAARCSGCSSSKSFRTTGTALNTSPRLHRRRDGKACRAAEGPHRRVGSLTRCTRRPRDLGSIDDKESLGHPYFGIHTTTTNQSPPTKKMTTD